MGFLNPWVSLRFFVRFVSSHLAYLGPLPDEHDLHKRVALDLEIISLGFVAPFTGVACLSKEKRVLALLRNEVLKGVRW